jgi:hypothetical protein
MGSGTTGSRFFTPHLFANDGGDDEASPSENPNQEAKRWEVKK